MQFTMATSRRGQSPVRKTKMIDPCPGPLKEGRPPKSAVLGHVILMLCPQSLLRQEGAWQRIPMTAVCLVVV